MLDFLIVGCGLFGSVFAQQCKEYGFSCQIIDKRNHIGGNVFSEKIEGINVSKYGPHIFFTNSDDVWNYANRFSKFTQYNHRIKASYNGRLYSLPINLQTLYEFYSVKTPEEAIKKLDEIKTPIDNPKNLEEWCLSQIGPDLYETFFKHYTTKQWKRDPKDLPSFIIKRLPIRTNFDDRYHESKYSGLPSEGYTKWISNIIEGIDVELGVDYFSKDWSDIAKKIIYTGPIDRLFNYKYGELDYRALRFDTKILNGNFQGIAQINYTDTTPYTRVVEHKHFYGTKSDKTVVTWEYPEEWTKDAEPYYPINDDKNNIIYKKYKEEMATVPNIIGGGRLFEYKYLDMEGVIASALKKAKLWLKNDMI